LLNESIVRLPLIAYGVVMLNVNKGEKEVGVFMMGRR
jgi:hypothetical protein